MTENNDLEAFSLLEHSQNNCKNGISIAMNNFNSSPRIVEVRIVFLTIGEVDTMNEKYQAQVKIRSKWYENEELEEYDPNKNWNPKLFIENALHDLKEEITYTITKLENKTMIVETRISRG